MASESGTTTSSLTEWLHESPFTFSFYQAARRLEALDPAKPRIGLSIRTADDPVRFLPAALAAV